MATELEPNSAELEERTDDFLVQGGTVLGRRLVLKRLRRAPVLSQDMPEATTQPKYEPEGLFQAAMYTPRVKVSKVRVLWRLLRLSMFGAYFGLCVISHWLTNRQPARRQKLNARKFRKILERSGGVMIKVGQQLSQRADVLPLVYCDELEKLLDEIEIGIDRADIEDAIERECKRPLQEVFTDFSYTPVGSASVSCVYHALLHSGQEVAVKIRRPHIRKQFTADLTAIAWALNTAEFLTIWRPGTFRNLNEELQSQLMEELDFRMEARYQELFRRYLSRQKKLNITAPKVYHELSGESVMISEFVTGYWVKNIIQKLKEGDELYLARLRRMDIDVKTVAKRLIRASHYMFHECPFFHGDPHASNIVVQPNNKIIMVDFGACGAFSQRDRNLMWRMNYYYSREDVAGMVDMVISIMEPLPPVNLDNFRKELLDAWWKGFYGIKSEHAAWWERTSFRLWLAFYQLMEKYQIPIPRKMLRFVRATLLYDTVAARLDRKINVFKEFEKYAHDVARRARRQIEACAIRQLFCGPDDSVFLKAEQIATVGNDFLYRARKFLDDPQFDVSAVAGKVWSAIRTLARFGLICFFATVGSAILALALNLRTKNNQGIEHSILDPLSNVWGNLGGGGRALLISWLAILSLLIFTYGRRLYLRFGDNDS
jgi:predicted unusual protein kinase regulating ubiquinone biosynthesis (AarF/ABC1/UbiB family)